MDIRHGLGLIRGTSGPRAESIQFNVRSAFASARAQALAKLTGMTATRIVEDALRGYVPAGVSTGADGPVRRGPLLVKRSTGAVVSLEEANAALDQVRERDTGR